LSVEKLEFKFPLAMLERIVLGSHRNPIVVDSAAIDVKLLALRKQINTFKDLHVVLSRADRADVELDVDLACKAISIGVNLVGDANVSKGRSKRRIQSGTKAI